MSVEEDLTSVIEPYSPELGKRLLLEFANQAVERVGHNGNDLNMTSLVLRNRAGDMVGVIVVHKFWGSLGIPYIFVEGPYRQKGLGRQLVRLACDYAKEHGCRFLTVETSSFEAIDFYLKLGFVLELTRRGYSHGVELHYLRYELPSVD